MKRKLIHVTRRIKTVHFAETSIVFAFRNMDVSKAEKHVTEHKLSEIVGRRRIANYMINYKLNHTFLHEEDLARRRCRYEPRHKR